MKLVIIANPISGGGRACKAVRDYIGRRAPSGWDVEILTTEAPGHAGALARAQLPDPPDLLGVCGGDGTVNEVASAIPRPPCPVALIPAGTANVVARELRVPLNPVKALQSALKMRAVRRVDLGGLNGDLRRFLFVAGIGFDAYVVSSVKPRLKKRLGMAAYAATIVSCLRNYTFPEFQVIAGSRAFAATSCLACNARSYGGGLLFCPDADMNDGLLDVLVLTGNRRLRLAAFLFHAWCGKSVKARWVHRLKAPRLQIEGGTDVLVQADGELVGSLPVEISLTDAIFPLVIP